MGGIDRCLIDGNILHPKALSLSEDFSKGSPEINDHIYINFITVYCYNYSILLLLIVVNILLCLVYKLGVHVQEKKT